VRGSKLEEGAAFYDFLAEGMPALLTEWHARRDGDAATAYLRTPTSRRYRSSARSRGRGHAQEPRVTPAADLAVGNG
jgi:hypothetical protein